jgi:hypothetical protein
VHKQQPPPLDYTTFSTSPGDLEGLPDTCFPLWLPQLDVQHAITGPGAGVADLQDAFGGEYVCSGILGGMLSSAERVIHQQQQAKCSAGSAPLGSDTLRQLHMRHPHATHNECPCAVHNCSPAGNLLV